ncbi:YwqG family protein [Zunongwangia sp. HRR-M8]|uniref:YwqG family protein n=1 Tax=Zunongwangia sp. HRR-M8 TaxID=3015170 RepID=UPI0022DD604D|nr:YwqG family protein [Zunongwangia sp. HRR-M8]WBL21170.1 YwqG family protein [Zunongwangia sp. HRR-M8]
MMDLPKLEKIMKEAKYNLAKKEAYLKSLAISSITITRKNEQGENFGVSKLGGDPEVPTNFEWPRHEFGDYRFIAQFNLSEITFPSPLPKTGMLSIFVADDEDQNIFWGADEYAKVFYFKEDEELQTYINTNITPSLRIFGFPIQFEQSIDIPHRPELFKEKELNKRQLSYVCDKVPSLIRKGGYNYLLGYPYYNSLAYDPRKGKEWVSLLTLLSIRSLEWNWHDGGYLMLFIEKDKLAKGDFSNIKTDAG